MIPRKEDKDIYEPDNGLPWYLWLIILAGIIYLLFAVGSEQGDKMAETLKDNRVYISKDTYDNFVRENP